jgi:hypothetical protein
MPYSSFCAPPVALRRSNINSYFTLWAPHLGQFSALATPVEGAPGCSGLACLYGCVLGSGGSCRQGWDHEPSGCRRGLWTDAGRVFCNDAEPGFSQIRSAIRDAGHCVRTARSRSENLVGPELSHALPALGPARQRVLGNACAQRLSVADRVRPAGSRWFHPATRTQSGSGCPAGCETAEEANCQEADAGGDSSPSRSTAADGLGSADRCSSNGCAVTRPAAVRPGRVGTVRDRVPLAVALVRLPLKRREPLPAS